jgi:hypothetical protein
VTVRPVGEYKIDININLFPFFGCQNGTSAQGKAKTERERDGEKV